MRTAIPILVLLTACKPPPWEKESMELCEWLVATSDCEAVECVEIACDTSCAPGGTTPILADPALVDDARESCRDRGFVGRSWDSEECIPDEADPYERIFCYVSEYK